MTSSNPTRGVIYIATGEPYRTAAFRSAESVRKHSPDLAIDLYTDVIPEGDTPFDHIGIVENPHPRSKVDYLQKSRFEETLYLDSDTKVVADITGMFDLLERFDIALAHAHARNRRGTTELWRTEIPDAFPQLNGGVILFRNSDAVNAMLKAWSDSYHHAGFSKDQVTLRELLWISDLRMHILPPEYNIRYSRYIDFWESWEADPKILHYAVFHNELRPKKTLLERVTAPVNKLRKRLRPKNR
ncbi:hypothetical protein BOW17_06375 [Solemya velum gill symbiont]|uniref:putative nucleotide-diphospho-sugar transferase n=1 Tax=Solemya velum gill symbiont TaxID=2340 RepID=UPI000996423B|nr:putative nucleotide-diphospho-sugar transferase [Solemya velum gill symbiont]OOY94453.1 hypothetical protein BOW17_06375 [Solemya velum gill symbiont]